MKVVESQIRKLEITEVEGLDPISVMIEEYEVGQAKVIIQCWDRSWNMYWGSMGGTLKEFFTRTNVHYLTDKFSTEIERGETGLDYHAMQEVFVQKVREYVIERVKDGYTKSPANRNVYDECVQVDLANIAPDHPYDTWGMDHWVMCEDSWKEVFDDEDFFTEWMYNNIPDIYEENHHYHYLGRVVTVVREAIINQQGRI